MTTRQPIDKLLNAIRENCAISDARDNGIFSLCILVLKLRNLYKWENGLPPWEEPDPGTLLDWIEARENSWLEKSSLGLNLLPGKSPVDPFSHAPVNRILEKHSLVYGAGYGRSLKAIFFVAEKLEEREVDGCRTIILGQEHARELAAPFAMVQEGIIFFRTEPFRYYFWDQIQEMRPSGRDSLLFALDRYGLIGKNGLLDRERLKARFEDLILGEMETFVRHEVGELQPGPLDGASLRKIIAHFPDSPVELVARGLKDLLADTHEKGLIGHIIAHRKEGSLGFYSAFLDGVRKTLFPEIRPACAAFIASRDWEEVDRARLACRQRLSDYAALLTDIAGKIDTAPREELHSRVCREILTPLGLN